MNCGECCESYLEVTPAEFTEMVKFLPEGASFKTVVLYDTNLQINPVCPLRVDGHCIGYSVRPSCCRAMVCMKSSPDSPIDKNRVTTTEYQEVRKPHVANAIEWGKAHGWHF
jgi:hypothetical protein